MKDLSLNVTIGMNTTKFRFGKTNMVRKFKKTSQLNCEKSQNRERITRLVSSYTIELYYCNGDSR